MGEGRSSSPCTLQMVALLFSLFLSEWVTMLSAFDPLPNGDGSSGTPGTGLRKVVSDWNSGGTAKNTVLTTYGPIEEWNVASVNSLNNVFYQKQTFNADLSKWDTAAVTNMQNSTSTPVLWFFRSLCRSSPSLFSPIFFFLRSSSTSLFWIGTTTALTIL